MEAGDKKFENIFRRKGADVDGEDCPEIICRKDPYQKYRKMSSFVNVQGMPTGDQQQEECPLNKESLGYYSWSLLHTYAAYYPQQPSAQQQQYMKGFLEGFRQFYPCGHCKPHFVKDYQRDPPQLDSRKNLSLWVCRQHNYVNKILGKKTFECEQEALLKRWRYGCQEQQEEL